MPYPQLSPRCNRIRLQNQSGSRSEREQLTRMPCTSVVPNRDRPFLPSESALNIHIIVDQVEAVFRNDIGLVSRNTIDSTIEAFVDIHCLPSGDSW